MTWSTKTVKRWVQIGHDLICLSDVQHVARRRHMDGKVGTTIYYVGGHEVLTDAGFELIWSALEGSTREKP